MRTKPNSITISAPGKIHLLGEHAVVYGKPALLASINLRVTVHIQLCHSGESSSPESEDEIDSGYAPFTRMTDIIEPIVKKYLKIKNIPPYQLEISSELPIGAGLGSSAAVSGAYIAALLSFLKITWDLKLINELTYEAEKVFHGNPSGGDNSTVVYGGLVWFRKETPPARNTLSNAMAGGELKIIQPLPFTVPSKLSKNFVLINTGTPKESTKEMVEMVGSEFRVQNSEFRKIFDEQEQLVRKFLPVIQDGNEDQLIKIIREGEKNLETIGVVSPYAASIIRKIEKAGGAAKICGAGGKTKATGILLCYHPQKKVIENIAKAENLPFFKVKLGVEGLRKEV